jgi:hypothetical protein
VGNRAIEQATPTTVSSSVARTREYLTGRRENNLRLSFRETQLAPLKRAVGLSGPSSSRQSAPVLQQWSEQVCRSFEAGQAMKP